MLYLPCSPTVVGVIWTFSSRLILGFNFCWSLQFLHDTTVRSVNSPILSVAIYFGTFNLKELGWTFNPWSMLLLSVAICGWWIEFQVRILDDIRSNHIRPSSWWLFPFKKSNIKMSRSCLWVVSWDDSNSSASKIPMMRVSHVWWNPAFHTRNSFKSPKIYDARATRCTLHLAQRREPMKKNTQDSQ